MKKFVCLVMAFVIFAGILAFVDKGAAAKSYYVKNKTLYVKSTNKKATGYVFFNTKTGIHDPSHSEEVYEKRLYVNGNTKDKVLYKGKLYIKGVIKNGTYKYNGKFYTKGILSKETNKHLEKNTLYCGQIKCKGLQSITQSKSNMWPANTNGKTWFLNGEKLYDQVYAGKYYDEYGSYIKKDTLFENVAVDPSTKDVFAEIAVNDTSAVNRLKASDFKSSNGKIESVRLYINWDQDYRMGGKNYSGVRLTYILKIKNATLGKKLSITAHQITKDNRYLKDQVATKMLPTAKEIQKSSYTKSYKIFKNIYNMSNTELAKRYGIKNYNEWKAAEVTMEQYPDEDYDDSETCPLPFNEYSGDDEAEVCDYYFNLFAKANKIVEAVDPKSPNDELKYTKDILLIPTTSKQQQQLKMSLFNITNEMLSTYEYEVR